MDSFAVEDIQDFLFDFTSWQHVSPLLFLALTGEEFQIMPELAQHRFRLMLDFLIKISRLPLPKLYLPCVRW